MLTCVLPQRRSGSDGEKRTWPCSKPAGTETLSEPQMLRNTLAPAESTVFTTNLLPRRKQGIPHTRSGSPEKHFALTVGAAHPGSGVTVMPALARRA
jgi:hypothetical protein